MRPRSGHATGNEDRIASLASLNRPAKLPDDLLAVRFGKVRSRRRSIERSDLTQQLRPTGFIIAWWDSELVMYVRRASVGRHQPARDRMKTLADRARNSGWSWLAFPQLGRKVERVMGIEPTLLVWDTRKEWPLPGIGRRSLNDCFWPILRAREGRLPIGIGQRPRTCARQRTLWANKRPRAVRRTCEKQTFKASIAGTRAGDGVSQLPTMTGLRVIRV